MANKDVFYDCNPIDSPTIVENMFSFYFAIDLETKVIRKFRRKCRFVPELQNDEKVRKHYFEIKVLNSFPKYLIFSLTVHILL